MIPFLPYTLTDRGSADPASLRRPPLGSRLVAIRVSGILLAIFLGVASRLVGQEPTSAMQGFEIQGPAFFALQVENAERAATWYARVFSLDPVKQIDADDGRFSIRILSARNLTVELIEMRDVVAPPQPHLGIFKLGFYVDDIDAAFSWFRSAGVDTDDTIFVDEALSVRSFAMRDPAGNRLQVFARCGEEDC